LPLEKHQTQADLGNSPYILMHRDQPKADKAAAMLKYFDWCYKHGGEMAEKLHYVPMPENVVNMVKETWANEVRAEGKPVTY